MRDLWRRSGLKRASLERLAAADAFRSLDLDRRQALWEVRGRPQGVPLPLFDHAGTTETGAEPEVALPVMPLSEHVVNDYRTLRLSLKAHPVSFLRARIAAGGQMPLAENGIITVLSGTKPQTTVTFNSEPGTFDFNLSDLPYGKALSSLDGNLMIERVPTAMELAGTNEDVYRIKLYNPGLHERDMQYFETAIPNTNLE